MFPDHFVPLAERTGVIHDLTRFMLGEAIRQHATWAAGGLVVPMAVNLSAQVLSDPQLPELIGSVCRREGVAPSMVELEVTETAAMADPATTHVLLGDLVGRGFRLALDDFGTGLSSLAYLRSLPVEVVKIDKSFVANLPDDPADAHIARGTIELAHGLEKRVVAEGVETAGALDYLLLVGCDAGQGYHWSRPLPADEFAAWATEWEKRSGGAPLALSATPVPEREGERLEALRRYRVLDTAYERVFDEIAAAAAVACGTPMSAITLVDRDRQWFKAQRGLGMRETARDLAFCAHTIVDPTNVMTVEDARSDPRFATNPLVTGEPNIRFYAGAPIVTPEGTAIGSMCVLDRDRRRLTGDQLEVLRQLSRYVTDLLEMRRRLLELSPGMDARSE